MEKNVDTLKIMFESQASLQKKALGLELPLDEPKQFYLHATACSIELGEAIQEDNRWKKMMGSRREQKLNREAKLEELVDAQCFLINSILYSGYTFEEFVEAYKNKNKINNERFGE